MNPITLMNMQAVIDSNKTRPINIRPDSPLASIIRYLFEHGPTDSKKLKEALNTKHNVCVSVNYLMQAPYKLIERANERSAALAIYKIVDNKTLADFGLDKESNVEQPNPSQNS